MKVLFISIQSGYEGGYPAAHLGFYRIKSMLIDNGIDVDIVNLDLIDFDSVKKDIEKGMYDMIGFSGSTYEMDLDLQLLWDCKKASEIGGKRCLIIAGGQAVTMNKKQWLENGTDIAVLGWGEMPMLRVCKRYMKDEKREISELCSGIPGLAYINSEGQLESKPSLPTTQEEFEYLNYERMLVTDIPYEHYWKNNDEKIKTTGFNNTEFNIKNIRLFTISHCPLRCAFCATQSFLPFSQGSKAQKLVMLTADQCHQLVLKNYNKYKAESFSFGEDNFVVSKQAVERAKEICKKIIHSKLIGELPKDIVFHCLARVDNLQIKKGKGEEKVINHELLTLMKQAGFVSVSTGCETFSDKLLRSPSVNKGKITKADNIDVCDALLSAGMVPQILLILGLPESSVDDLLTTMKISADFILKGAQVGVTSLLFADQGSPLTESGIYPHTFREWINPYTGDIVKMNGVILPKDPFLRDVFEKIDEKANQEIERMRKDTPWGTGILPKFFVALATFIAYAKLLNSQEMVTYFEDVFQKRCVVEDLISDEKSSLYFYDDKQKISA